jgi:hypothetical protein
VIHQAQEPQIITFNPVYWGIFYKFLTVDAKKIQKFRCINNGRIFNQVGRVPSNGNERV